MNTGFMEYFADVIGFKNSKIKENSHRKEFYNSLLWKWMKTGDVEENSMLVRLRTKKIASSYWIHHAKSPLVASWECKTDSSRLAEPLQCFTQWTENNEMESIRDDFMVIVAIMYYKTKLKDMFPLTICHSFYVMSKMEIVSVCQHWFRGVLLPATRDHIPFKKTPPI